MVSFICCLADEAQRALGHPWRPIMKHIDMRLIIGFYSRDIKEPMNFLS